MVSGLAGSWLMVRNVKMNKLILLALPLLLLAIPKGYSAVTNPAAKKYSALINYSEKKHKLPKNVLARLLQTESGFNPKATNPSGAKGIAQIIPKWHPSVDPFNPKEAIPYAAKYLRKMYDRFGSWDKALAAYNYGPTNLSRTMIKYNADWKKHLPAETKNYIRKILQ